MSAEMRDVIHDETRDEMSIEVSAEMRGETLDGINADMGA